MVKRPRAFIARHFIHNWESLDSCVQGIDSLLIAKTLSDSSHAGFEMGLKLAVDHRLSFSQEGLALYGEVKRLESRLPHDFFFLYDPQDRGPGVSFRQVVFNPTFASGTVVLSDLDAYVPDSPDAFERIVEITDKVEKDNALFGMGSRDRAVVLAEHPENNALRIIHELYHSLAIVLFGGPGALPLPDQHPSSVTPAYAELGESSTGLWVMNCMHLKYGDLLSRIHDASKQPGMHGFATEYYTSIIGSLLGQRISRYVSTRQNQFYHSRSVDDERKSICNLIRNSTAALGKTDARDPLLSALTDNRALRRLEQFYCSQDVAFVRDLMQSSLTQDMPES